METSDFLQADDIYKVMNVPFSIHSGNKTDNRIEKTIGMNSEGRQGRYYRSAAEKFGLIKNSNNSSVLTDSGKKFIGLKDNKQRIDYIAKIMRKMEVFSAAIKYLEDPNTEPSLDKLKEMFFSKYPGSSNTAERRFSTFKKYLTATGFLNL